MTPSPLAFVGDVHLDRGDPDLGPFTDFLLELGRSTRCIVLMGDLFNIWIGRTELEQPHQRAVLEVLAELRRQGVVVRYVEGNRDYRIADAYVGAAIDESTDSGIEQTVAGRRYWAIHGDLVNAADRRYRMWHRLSRSSALWTLFHLLPRSHRTRLAESLEARMRGTNTGFKREFPEAAIRDYATPFIEGGHDAVVLGHFHVERELPLVTAGREGRVYVLPLWKDGRRFLEVAPDGRAAFREG